MFGEQIRNFLNFRKDPLNFLHAGHLMYGERMKLHALGTKVHVIFTATAAQHVLLKKNRQYGRCNIVMDRIKPLTGENGIIQLQGRQWSDLRQKYVEMLSPKAMREKGNLFQSKAEQSLEPLAKFRSVDMLEVVSEYALATALTLFAGSDNLETRVYYHQYLELNKLCGSKMFSPIVFPSLRGYLTQRRLAHRVQALMATTPLKNELAKEGTALLSDQIRTFLFASHETTTSSIVSAIYLLASDPACQQKYRMFKSKEEKTSYITAIFNEALRLYPPAWMVARTASADDQELGVKKGDHVLISIREIHRNSAYWEEPHAFHPERHLQPYGVPCQFMPFGAGPKKCIGPVLAEISAINFIRILLEKFRISTSQELRVKAHTTLVPIGPVEISLEPLQ